MLRKTTFWNSLVFICENSWWLLTHNCPPWRVVRYFFTGYTGEYRGGCMTRDWRRYFKAPLTPHDLSKMAAFAATTEELCKPSSAADPNSANHGT